VPSLARRKPIKKWSAAGALIAAAAYLLLSGVEVAAQRSFIMTAIVLVGVMADRTALTLRTIAIAAIAVLMLAPQSVVHPSFQMSFAALGCIARLADGRLLSVAASADAFEEDCRKAALVVTARNAPPACAAMIIDRNTVHARGAMALRRKGEGWDITAARPAGQDRPWARGAATEETTTPAARQQTPPRDATPRPEDLEAGD
jgi:hypothetical protein